MKQECTYESIRKAFDWHHGDTNGNDLGYCYSYVVTFCNPDWSRGQWFNISGISTDGSIHDLLSIGYDFQYPWLVQGTYFAR